MNRKRLLSICCDPFPSPLLFNLAMLCFRVAVSLELILVHGLKKLGIGVAEAEAIPNPLHFPDFFNNAFAISANIVFPCLVIIGLFTRLAVIPTIAVTLTGYFVQHWNDTALAKDVPFIYSILFLLILALGPGKYSLDYYIDKKL